MTWGSQSVGSAGRLGVGLLGRCLPLDWAGHVQLRVLLPSFSFQLSTPQVQAIRGDSGLFGPFPTLQ